MSSFVLEQYLRTAVTKLAFDLRERMRDQRGQTTVEWLVIMVGLVALAGVLASSGIWTNVANSLGGAFTHLIDTVKGKVDG